jgi:protein phosphatase
MPRLQIAFKTENEKDAPTVSESFFCKDNLFLVAEGLGGDYLGEMAKEKACKEIPNHFFNHLSKDRSPGAAMVSALEEVNGEMLLERKKTGKRMAASVSVVYISSKIMYFCHLGDSRIYCLQKGEIVQLTRDHTVGEENSYAEIGGQDPRLLRALTDGLGIHEEPDIALKTFALRDKDIILMTTEGLTRYLSNMQMLKLSMKQNSVKRLAARLIEEAKRKGARNSMTLGIIRFGEFPIWVDKRIVAGSAIVIALAVLLGIYAMKSRQEPVRPVPGKVTYGVAKPAAEPLPKTPPPSEPEETVRAAGPTSKSVREESRKKEAPLKQEIHEFLREWKTAWEKTAGPQGNISAYMSFYSEDFQSLGMDKNGWREKKAERNKKKQWIKVELKEIAVGEPTNANQVDVRFHQEYRSSDSSLSTNKSLVLKKGNAGWRIAAERDI